MGTPYTATAASNTEVVLTIDAVSGVAHELEFVGCGFDGDPAATKLLTVESPSGTILHRWPITAGGPAPIGYSGSCIKGTVGQAMIVRLAADSGGAVGYVNAVKR